MKPATRIALCTAAAFSLSGCQSFVSALGFGPKDSEPRRAEASTSVFGQDELELGRKALKAGYPANSIKLFRLAALDENVAPDAFNGLGVAYAKLGRADLAERYFKMAVSLDGSNPKYAANLQRFYNSPLGNSHRALAMRESEAEEQLAAIEKSAEQQGLLGTPAQTQASERRGSLTLERPPVRLSRTSGREIRLSTGATAAGRGFSLPAVAVRNPAKTPVVVETESEETEEVSVEEPEAKSSQPKQISMAGVPSSNASYPVRISISKPQGGKSATAKRANYPLRVALAPSQVSE